MSYNIAIDGPAGAGKSTIAREVARRLNSIYVDTGAMYRAMALYMIRKGIDRNDLAAMEEVCEDADISIDYVDGEQVVLLNSENVNPFIRTQEVSDMASVSSGVLKVREKLVKLQQGLAKRVNVVMDGRDIATKVLPDAELKIYLTASVDERAERRYKEQLGKGIRCELSEIKKDIAERDYRDTHRENSPLVKAEDAILVDTSLMNIDEVVDTIMSLVENNQKA